MDVPVDVTCLLSLARGGGDGVGRDVAFPHFKPPETP